MRHILFTLQGCAFDPLNDRSYIEVILKETAEICKSTLLDISSHKFQPQGVTAVALLAESHISIHTWPEKGMAVCDVFTCGDHTMPESAVRYMYDTMQSTDMVSEKFIRPLE